MAASRARERSNLDLYLISTFEASSYPNMGNPTTASAHSRAEQFRLNDLPTELWQEIISQLEADQASLYALTHVNRVCYAISIQFLYRSIDIRDPTMCRQLLLLGTLNSQTQFMQFVRKLTIGICPPDHENGDFIYDLIHLCGMLTNLKHLAIVRTIGTRSTLYWDEGNRITPFRRYWRGEITDLPANPTYPTLESFRVDIPMGDYLRPLFQHQTDLKSLELWFPFHSYVSKEIFQPQLEKLAISGESILTTIPSDFKPTHLAIDCPSSNPLWPSRYRQGQQHFLSMPDTSNLRSLEISSSLVDEIKLCITTTDVTFPSLVHFGIFTNERADERFFKERLFLMMWVGSGYQAPVAMMNLLKHFPQLESLSVQPEGMGDWTDQILDSQKFIDLLRHGCPNFKRLLWRSHKGVSAGIRYFENGLIKDASMSDIDVADYWKSV
ncbi:hypothetical protein FRB91_004188 [Serendipita sp. 411]|nr:hypothetical protein FRB91_004188 [Serendipita sp. 411]